MSDLPSLEAFETEPAPRVAFGRGALGRLGEFALAAAPRAPAADDPLRVLLVSDPGVIAAGHVARAVDSLAAAGCDVAVFDGAAENPTTQHVERGVAFARPRGIELIVAVGGGSSMDCAKGVNFLLTNGGAMEEYWGDAKARRPMLHFVAVPTTAGTGSEAQRFALIADPRTHQKMACGDRKARARAVILDPELTLTQPRALTVAAGLDALSHALESYVCTRANAVARMYAREAWRLLSRAFESVLERPADVEARAAMLLGAHLAGRAIENAMLGAAHACANPLTAEHGLTHGIAVALMLPHVLRYNARTVAGLYDGLGPPDALAAEVERLMQRAGVAPRLRDHGVPHAALRGLARGAAAQWTARFNPRPVAESDCAALYEEAW